MFGFKRNRKAITETVEYWRGLYNDVVDSYCDIARERNEVLVEVANLRIERDVLLSENRRLNDEKRQGDNSVGII